MAIKHLLKMTEVDRYTQDGRDELNKALQADVQDVRYKTGDISQKTGLQKQPDGSWAPPKKGARAGANQKALETFNKMTGSNKSDFETLKSEYNRAHEKNTGKKPGERQLKAEQEQRAADDPRGYGYEEPPMEPAAGSKPAEANKNFERVFNNQPFNPTEGQTFTWKDSDGEETMGEVKSVGAKANAVSGFAQVVYEDIETGMPVHAVVQFDNQGKTKSVENVIKAKSEAEAREIFKRYTKDTVPRELTGDCKIKIRPETQDVKYKIGDISQKTGLQKTANGWRPVKKNGAGKNVTGNAEQRKHKHFMGNSQNHFEAATQTATTVTDIENLKAIKSFMDEEHATFKNALYSKAESLARKGSRGLPDAETKQNEKSLLKFAEAAGMADDLKLYIKEEVNSKYEFGEGAGIPLMKEEDFIGKTYKDFVTAIPRGQFMITRNQDNPDGSSENDFTDVKNGGKKITVKFDKDGKITSVKQHENPTRQYKANSDSAPRQLTGDCKIRVRR